MVKAVKEIFINIIFNIKRNKRNWIGLIVSLVMLPCVVMGYLSFFQDGSIGKIAISGADMDVLIYFQENGIIYEEIQGMPDDSYKINGDFLGYISYREDGSYLAYETYVGSRELIEQIANQTYSHLDKKKNVLIDLFPSIIVVIFLEAVLNMKSFIEDRQNGLISRLNIIGVKNGLYFFSMLLYNVLLMLVPLLLALVIGQAIYRVDYGYSAIQIGVICTTAAFLSCLFAFALCSIVRRNDSAIMVGNIVAVISSLLSGVFGSWKGIDFISKIMPQRMLLEWIKEWKQQEIMYNSYLWYILSLMVLLFLFTLFMNQMKYYKA